MKRVRALWKLVKLTALKWDDDNIAWLSAALAYYTLFSLAPTFIIVVTIGGKIFGEEAVTGQIVNYLNGLVGYDSAVAIQRMIEAGRKLTQFSLGNLIGIFIILFAATNVFVHLKSTLNAIWNIPGPQRHWFLTILLNRFFSVLMVLSIGVLLLLLVLVDVSLAVFDEILTTLIPGAGSLHLLQIGSQIFSFAIATILFSAIYKMLPDTAVAWKDVWSGAAIAAFMFTLGKFLIALYLAHSSMLSIFGAASSFVAILIWVYYSAQILLLGASFTHFYALEYGSLAGSQTEKQDDLRVSA